MRFHCALAALPLLLSACAMTSGTGGTARPAIEKANAAFAAALKAGDSRWIADNYYAPDATVLPPGSEPAAGREKIEAFAASMIQLGLKDMRLEIDRVEERGDLAYEMGRYEMKLQPPQGDAVTDRGKYVVIWQRQPGGDWKVKVDIFNSSLPAH